MGLVRDWSRQTARAAGVSLIAPLALLGAAAVVAAGGGLGGLGSLTQIASGPALPQTDLAAPPRTSSLGRAQVVALEPGDTGAAAPAGGSGAAPSGSSPSGAGPSPGRTLAQSPAGPPSGSVGGGPAPTPDIRPPSRTPVASAPSPLTAAAPPPPAPAPPPLVGQVLDAPRDLGESLLAPIGAAPVTQPPAPPLPVGQVLDAPQDLGESLPAPVGPPVIGGLGLLLGPRR